MGAGGWRALPGSGSSALLVLASVVCLGCGDAGTTEAGSEEETPEPVELANGDFIYECVNNDDLMCPEELVAEAFPEQVAVGARFDATFVPAEETESAIEIRSGSSAYIARAGQAFRAEQAGRGVLLARRASDGAALGFVHLVLADLAELSIQQRSGDPALIVMVADEQQALRVVPLGAGGKPLGGAIDYTWTSSDETVLQPMVASPSALMTVLARGAGDATLTVTAGTQSAQISITVTE